MPQPEVEAFEIPATVEVILVMDRSYDTNIYQKFLLFLVLGIVSIYYIFSPVIHIPFHHHDSYKFSLGDSNKSCEENIGNAFNHNLSRHISAYTDCANFKYVNTLERMHYARIICAVLIGVVFALVAAWLCYVGVPAVAAFCISGCLCVLPGMQTTMMLSVEFIPLTIIFAFLSAICLRLADDLWENNKFHQCRYQIVSYFIISIIFLFLSLFSYPALSAFFLMPALISILVNPLDKWSWTRKYVLRDIFVFGICCLIFFVIAKYHAMQTGQPGIAAYRYDKLNLWVINRIPGLLVIFTQQANIYYNHIQSAIIYFIAILGVIRALLYSFKSQISIISLFQAVILTITIVLLGSVVYLLAAEVVIAGRVMYVFQAMSVLIVAWALYWLVSFAAYRNIRHRIYVSLVGIFFLINASTANYYTTKSALNDNLELNYMVSTIANYLMNNKNKLKRVHIIAPSVISFNGLPPADDIFNYNTTRGAGDMPSVLYTALMQLVSRKSVPLRCSYLEYGEEKLLDQEKKCIDSAPSNAVIFTFSRRDKPIYISSDMVIINMNTLNPYANQKKPDLENLTFDDPDI